MTIKASTKILFLGLLCALIGITLCGYYQGRKNEIDEAESRTQHPTVAGTTITVAKKFTFTIGGKSKQTPDGQRNFEAERASNVGVRYAGFATGLLALILGAIGWLLRGNLRLVGIVAGLSFISIAWEYFLIGVAAAAFLIIIANLG